MADNDRFASIADSSKPNAGRIYDFLLGGHHNFEVDRQAAGGSLKLDPGFPRNVRTIRWFLGEAVRRLLADGFTQFIDFASGLPTVGSYPSDRAQGNEGRLFRYRPRNGCLRAERS